MMYYNGTNWVALAGNNSGTQILTQNSSGVPSWAATGSVSSVTCGTGLTGGVITTTGTCALAMNSAVLQANPANPTGTTNTTGLMMGLGGTCKLTPTYSTRIKVEFLGNAQTTGAAGTFTTIKIFFGTGTAPVNGAAITGTQIGNLIQPVNAASNIGSVFINGGVITGLTPGTAYWFDISVASSNVSNTATPSGLSCNAVEVM
jgi:hypothetical protein